jgi:hypothetical protein
MATVTEATELFRRYHSLIREVAASHSPDEAWHAEVERIVRRLDEDCRELSRSGSDLFRDELSIQLEHELLRCTNPAAKSVLSVVLKRIDAI